MGPVVTSSTLVAEALPDCTADACSIDARVIPSPSPHPPSPLPLCTALHHHHHHPACNSCTVLPTCCLRLSQSALHFPTPRLFKA